MYRRFHLIPATCRLSPLLFHTALSGVRVALALSRFLPSTKTPRQMTHVQILRRLLALRHLRLPLPMVRPRRPALTPRSQLT